MAKYRIKVPKYWTDPRTQKLTDKQHRVFDYCITGPLACIDHHCTGIYEIYRGTFQNSPFNYELSEIDDVFSYFNKENWQLIQYDKINHMVFIPSFYKYNSSYKKGLEAVMKSFDETYEKAPQFWQSFSNKYYNDLWRASAKSWDNLNKKINEGKIDNDEKDELCDKVQAEMSFLEKLKHLQEYEVPKSIKVTEVRQLKNRLEFQI